MDTQHGSGTLAADNHPFTYVGGMLERVPCHLASTLAPATWIIHEWTNYVLSYHGATTLRIGSREIRPTVTSSDGVSHFTVRFENELGLAKIQPLQDGKPHGTGIHLEVLAKKFPNVEYSVAFLNSLLSDLFARGSSLPFDIVRRTERTIRDRNRAPNDLFAFHFFRHHYAELIRSIQAIMGGPHRVLADRIEHVRPHEVRRIDAESLHHLLLSRSDPGLPDGSAGGTALQRLRPERVMQRVPDETYDTPENRFVISIARRMFMTIRRIQMTRWYERVSAEGIAQNIRGTFDLLHHHLRQFVTDPRFAALEDSTVVPAQSRVLQRKDGYREMVQLWDAFHHYQEPVYEDMQRAIDIRDTPTLYEFWLLFELIDVIQVYTGVRPVLGGYNDLLQPGWRFRARFPDIGTLTYQESYGAGDVYSRINLRPDFVWQTKEGRRIILDAKFAVSYPWPDPNATDQENFERSRATSGDISAMHAYRDAINGVSAAIVLFPGNVGRFHASDKSTQELTSLSELIPQIVTGALDGIGAIPMSPASNSFPPGKGMAKHDR
jgi:predicted component of viral defense system (DUF524 family)